MAIDGTLGNDSLTGTAGADEINGFDGDDTIAGGAGNDTVAGGTGSDVFEIVLTPANRTFFIMDFTVGAGGDVLSLGNIAAASTGLSPDANPFDPALGYVRIVHGESSLFLDETFTNYAPGGALQWDPDGAAGPSGWFTQCVLDGDGLAGIALENISAGGTVAGVLSVEDLDGELSGPGIGASIIAAIDYSLGFIPVSGLKSTQLTLVGDAKNATGNAGPNVLQGNAWNNVLSGLDGNDILKGVSGNDTLDGGAYMSLVAGPLPVPGTGDQLYGGEGDDVYIVDSGNDGIYEEQDQGLDTIKASISLTLGANIEYLVLTGNANRSGTGNELDNRLTGNGGNNRLLGAEGSDMLLGGAGNDTLDGSTGGDKLVGGAGNDVLVWGVGDRLEGGTNTDTVKVKGGVLDMTDLGATIIVNVEVADLRGAGKKIVLTKRDVLDMSATDSLKVLGDAGDTVDTSGFVAQGVAVGGFRTYKNGAATLVVDTDISVI